MRLNPHYNLVGKHAFLSASTNSWINYTDEKMDARFIAAMAAQRGTELHALAQNLIRLGVKLPRTTKTLDAYVNDAIGYLMTPEQPLYYSDNAFGTADAVSFRKNVLRIHDLKTGIIHAPMTQLEIYAAFFCLEYQIKPMDIEIELRIYQNDDIQSHVPDPVDIMHIMDKIVTFDKRINTLREEAAL